MNAVFLVVAFDGYSTTSRRVEAIDALSAINMAGFIFSQIVLVKRIFDLGESE